MWDPLRPAPQLHSGPNLGLAFAFRQGLEAGRFLRPLAAVPVRVPFGLAGSELGLGFERHFGLAVEVGSAATSPAV